MTSDELKQFNEIMRESIPVEKRPLIRRIVRKDMDFNDVKTVLQAFSTDNGIINPVVADTGLKSAVNGSNRDKQSGDKKSDLEKTGDNISDNPDNTKMERVAGEVVANKELDIVQLTSDIMDLIHNYLVMSGLDDDKDLVKAPQRFWGAVCSYIGDNLIKPIVKPMQPITISGRVIPDNSVDIPKLAQCLRVYCNLCDKYNKAVLVDHAANFSGLSRTFVFNIREKLTPYGVDLWKKREDSIIAGILDGKSGNITGSAIVLNHDYGYATNQTHTEKKETIVMYPALSFQQEQKPPQIATTETKQVL